MTDLFLQGRGGSSTLDSIEALLGAGRAERAFMCFAYATLTGCVEFEKRMGRQIWRVPTRWLLGIDYGRSQPAALEFLAGQSNSEVRIHDGVNVIQTSGFFPAQDYHLKACHVRFRPTGSGFISGSGNFSRNGLTKSIECGASVSLGARRQIDRIESELDRLWLDATPVGNIIRAYKSLWKPGASQSRPAPQSFNQFDRFWIEAGYITPNRGGREGNQFDMPRGVHTFFGLSAGPHIRPGMEIGTVTFVGNGVPLTRVLRLGNNSMEKLTLPFPEIYPFGTYSGKIIEFERATGGFKVNAFELDEFDQSTRQLPSKVSLAMGSGRSYGFR